MSPDERGVYFDDVMRQTELRQRSTERSQYSLVSQLPVATTYVVHTCRNNHQLYANRDLQKVCIRYEYSVLNLEVRRRVMYLWLPKLPKLRVNKE